MHRDPLPIIAGEWGYATCSQDSRGAEPAVCNPGGTTGLTTLADQARFVARQRLVSALLGVVVTIWYDWRNDCQDCYGAPQPCSCSPMYQEGNFGLVHHDFNGPNASMARTPKPAFTAAVTVQKLLGDRAFQRRLCATATTDPWQCNDNVYILEFDGGAIAAWASIGFDDTCPDGPPCTPSCALRRTGSETNAPGACHVGDCTRVPCTIKTQAQCVARGCCWRATKNSPAGMCYSPEPTNHMGTVRFTVGASPAAGEKRSRGNVEQCFDQVSYMGDAMAPVCTRAGTGGGATVEAVVSESPVYLLPRTRVTKS